MAKLHFIILTTFLLFTLTHSHKTPDQEPETRPDPESDTTNILLPSKMSKLEPEPKTELFPNSIILDKESLNTIPSRIFTLRPINHQFSGNLRIWRSGHRHGHRCRHKRHHHHHHHHLRHKHATWGGRVFGREIHYGDDMIGNVHGVMRVRGGDVRGVPAKWLKVRSDRPLSLRTWYKLLRHERKEKHAAGIFKSIRKFLNNL